MANKHPIYQRLYSCLGEVISIRRKRLGMSQEDLAKESGVDRTFISNLESGKRNPSLGTVASIADGLRLRLAGLVTQCENCFKRAS